MIEELKGSTQTMAVPHASGDQLLAVAEGHPEHQPDAEVLAHLFSCEECGRALAELRQGLASLGNSEAASPLDAANPLEAAFAASAGGAGSEAEKRARRLTTMVFGMGLLAVGALILVRLLMNQWS